MRALVHDGCPLSTVADTLLGNIGFHNKAFYSLKRTKREWLCRLLTAGNTDTHTDTLTDTLTDSLLYCYQVTRLWSVWTRTRRRARYVAIAGSSQRWSWVMVVRMCPACLRAGTWTGLRKSVVVSFLQTMLTPSSLTLNASFSAG